MIQQTCRKISSVKALQACPIAIMLPLLAAFGGQHICAQDQSAQRADLDVSGVWESGRMTQHGAPVSLFITRFELTQTGDQISGEGRREVPNKPGAYVVTRLAGTRTGNTVMLRDAAITEKGNAPPSGPGSYWCLTSMQLTINSPDTLSGTWTSPPPCHYGEITLTRESPCSDIAAKLQQIQQQPGDPINTFISNQTCITARACELKSTLQDPAWLDKVLPDFVNPFLAKNDGWPWVIQRCHEDLPWFKGMCAGDMAAHHIFLDLQSSLNKNGCGTAADWATLGAVISQCTSEGFAADTPGLKQLENLFANEIVQFDRNTVRSRCVTYYKSKGLQ